MEMLFMSSSPSVSSVVIQNFLTTTFLDCEECTFSLVAPRGQFVKINNYPISMNIFRDKFVGMPTFSSEPLSNKKYIID